MNVWTHLTCAEDAVSAETIQEVITANVLEVTDWMKLVAHASTLTNAETESATAVEDVRIFQDPSDVCAVADTCPAATAVAVKMSTSATETRAQWDRCARTREDRSSVVARAV